MWPDRRLVDLFQLEHPIIQAPMAGSMDWELAAAASEAGALGSLPCGMLTAAQARAEVEKIRARTRRPINLNFFCHRPPTRDNAREAAWRDRLKPYYVELGIDPNAPPSGAVRVPFDAEMCEAVVELKPAAASFHFGLPEPKLLERVRGAGCKIMSSATTVAEAKWLAERGVDAIIAQGVEAGGHRGMFLTADIASQVGTLALVPQVVDAVSVPVIAAGGIADARGIVAALALGAAGVQIGTAFLFCPEAKVSAPHRAALKAGRDDTTALTNLISGGPARGHYNRVMRELGPMAESVPEYPLAAIAIGPLRAKAESQGRGDFSPLWSGEAARLGRELPAAELVRTLAGESESLLRKLGTPIRA